jgi:hypothetical protein
VATWEERVELCERVALRAVEKRRGRRMLGDRAAVTRAMERGKWRCGPGRGRGRRRAPGRGRRPAGRAGVLHEWVVEGQNGQVAIFRSANYFVRDNPNVLHSGTEGILAMYFTLF